MLPSCRNQSIDLNCKSIDRFLYGLIRSTWRCYTPYNTLVTHWRYFYQKSGYQFNPKIYENRNSNWAAFQISRQITSHQVLLKLSWWRLQRNNFLSSKAYVSNKSRLYLTNLYLTNLYLKHLMRIQGKSKTQYFR